MPVSRKIEQQRRIVRDLYELIQASRIPLYLHRLYPLLLCENEKLDKMLPSSVDLKAHSKRSRVRKVTARVKR